MRANTDRMLSMIDCGRRRQRAVPAGAPVVFPEFAHAAPVFPTVRELLEKLAVPIPNEHTERLDEKAREHDIYIQSGSMLEEDRRWPGVVFNTTCLIGPEGHPLQVPQGESVDSRTRCTASPHDLPGYDEPLFPVADTPIGRIGCAICYDWLFPEAIRQLAANGAEVLVRVSAYMDPWGATEPMNWWTIINRARAIENIAYRRRREPGREPAALSAVLVAGRIAGRRLRRPAARRRVARSRRTDRRRADRHLGAAPRARDAVGPPHARASSNRGVPGLRGSPLPARDRRAADLRGECRAD